MIRGLLLNAAMVASGTVQAADAIRFVACPIYRNTDAGRKSGCWVADDAASSIRYDIGLAPTKPDWNRAVLVEGTIAQTQDRACGGVTLDPVRVSVLSEPCTRHMLPAEDYPGRRFVLPARNLRPLSDPPPNPPPPYAARQFDIFYDFGSSFLVYQNSDYLLDTAARWIKAARPARIVVHGYAVTAPAMISGRSLAEPAALAGQRADAIRRSLILLGIDAARISMETSENPAPSALEGNDGLAEPSRRRVSILTDF